MADSLVIDKQSKLFQKFIQSKAQKDQQCPPLPGNQTSQALRQVSTKENMMNASNIPHNQIQDNERKCQRETKESKNFALKRQGHQMETVKSDLRDQRWVHNSLNIEGGLGLDKILKRAIEKVRSSKIQELYINKKERVMQQDDSLQKLPRPRRQQTCLQNDCTQSILSQKQGQEASKQQVVNENHNLTITTKIQQQSKQSRLNLQQQKVIVKLQAQVSGLKQKVKQQRDRSEALKVQINKLQRQINLEIDLHNQTQRERQQLVRQISQLERFTSEKEKQLKKHCDDANYWRNQHQLLTINITTLKDSLNLLEKKTQTLKSQNDTLRTDKVQRQEQFVQMKIDMAKMNEETKLAKQYLYQLTIKLYHYQKEIQSLKGTCVHHTDPQPKRNAEVEPKQEVKDGPMTRKRQFSRERSVSSFKPDTHLAEIIQKKTSQTPSSTEEPTIPQPRQITHISETDITRQAKVAAIKAQLQQLNESKIINGKIRRRKIELERELQQFAK